MGGQQDNPADSKTRQALLVLSKQYKSRILGFRQTLRNGEDDVDGYDWFVFLAGGLIYGFSTTWYSPRTTKKNIRDKINRHRKNHPRVDLFVIANRHQSRQIARRIIKKLNKAIRRAREIEFNGHSPAE